MALTTEPAEKNVMYQAPHNHAKFPLVDSGLLFYSFFFYGTLETIGAFYLYFLYMAGRGPLREASIDYQGHVTFPISYTPDQLLFAWDW